MDLISRAREVVVNGRLDNLQPLLLDCINARSPEGFIAVKRLAQDIYEDDAFNMLFKTPATYSLLAWRDDGLKAIVENALKEHTLKSFSLAFHVLASLASGSFPEGLDRFMDNSVLAQLILEAINEWSDVAVLAQQYLDELVISIEDDNRSVLFYAAHTLLQLSILDLVAAQYLTLALSLRWISVGPPVIKSYERLLLEQASDETVFQDFFTKNPLRLDPMAFGVWAQPDFHGQREPDFVIQRSDNTYIVVEIETPSKLLITKNNQLSADATHAITQVLEYRSFLLERFSDASSTFPNFSVPMGLVVIGMERSLNAEQLAALRRENEVRHGITIVGFDTLSMQADAISQNIIHGTLPVKLSGRLR